MNGQLDLVGDLPEPRKFKDIRNTRPSVAEEKANLVLELGRLCATPPQSVANGSINLTRQWLATQKASKATAASARASVLDLDMAIKAMRAYL